MIAIIDNYDSLVFNIARYLRELGETTEVIRNDAISVSELYQLKPRHQPGRRDSIELRHRLKADGHSVPVIYMTVNDPPAVARLRFKADASPI